MLMGGIGFFDSGVGGLSVLFACREILHGRPVYYYGDNARAPYGNRSLIDLRAYVREAFDLFEKLQVEVAVVACNTVTALLIEELRESYPFPVVGMEPALKPAMESYSCDIGRRVLLLATKATCESERLKDLIARMKAEYQNVEVLVEPCLTLAERIEEMCLQEEGMDSCLSELPKIEADAVVLGCTHYSLIKREISGFYKARVFDGNDAVARRLSTMLRSGWGKGEIAEANERKNGEVMGFDHFCHFLTLLSSLRGFFGKKKKKGRRFRLRKNCVCFTCKNVAILYFMGSGRVQNRQFCERMFGF